MSLNVGIIGTGAIANLHARVYRQIGFNLRVCTDAHEPAGQQFAGKHGVEFLPTAEAVCAHPEVDFVDVCTFPDYRLQVVEMCATHKKAVQVQKPIATSPEVARRMIDVARSAGITLGVVSQHRFDESSTFLFGALRTGRLGRLLQCDAYVKWHRTAQYYSRPIKGSWTTEGGGALMNQAIHQVDLLRWLVGPVAEVFGMWQIGGLHEIESEDVLSAVLTYENGATGVIQAATALWPGYSERIELHGTKGSAIITGDRLTSWDVQGDSGDRPPLSTQVASGASDPMAISLEPFERQFRDFGEAVVHKRRPLIAGEDGLEAIEIVDAIYRSCRSGQRIRLTANG
jgi:UDP-N-acetyl-2-amino-2-deoxyglucuronate dehydrogenase